MLIPSVLSHVKRTGIAVIPARHPLAEPWIRDLVVVGVDVARHPNSALAVVAAQADPFRPIVTFAGDGDDLVESLRLNTAHAPQVADVAAARTVDELEALVARELDGVERAGAASVDVPPEFTAGLDAELESALAWVGAQFETFGNALESRPSLDEVPDQTALVRVSFRDARGRVFDVDTALPLPPLAGDDDAVVDERALRRLVRAHATVAPVRIERDGSLAVIAWRDVDRAGAVQCANAAMVIWREAARLILLPSTSPA